MDFDWVPKLLPLVNATGVPLLAIGFYLLFRAYQKSIDTYKETHEHLSDENKRLRERLQSSDTGYFDQINKMRDVVSKSVDTISDLQARKVALLSKPDDIPRDAIISDVNKINEAISLMQELTAVSKEVRSLYQKHIERVEEEVRMKEYHYHDLAKRIGNLSEKIGDTSSRVLVVSVISSDKAIEQIKKEAGEQKRGIVIAEGSEEEKSMTSSSSPLMLGAPEETFDVLSASHDTGNPAPARRSRALDKTQMLYRKEEEGEEEERFHCKKTGRLITI
jgi:hypothetical protein